MLSASTSEPADTSTVSPASALDHLLQHRLLVVRHQFHAVTNCMFFDYVAFTLPEKVASEPSTASVCATSTTVVVC